ncbi:MAG: SpoIIE family protein phosphatase [Kiritimatiellae bacterium]|jgi:sigma-B regulation protein RsbU (phosphoserine phosphatase)|nr:SpoIIE family protein phosphatase [Kiritimatiellia bacterium]
MFQPPVFVGSFWLSSLGFLAVFLFFTNVLGAYFSIRILRKIRLERDNLVKEKEVIFNYVQNIGETFTESETLDVDRLMQRVLFYALRTTHTSGGAIYLREKGDMLRARAVSGVFPPMFNIHQFYGGMDVRVLKNEQIEEIILNTRISVGEGLIGQAADFGTPVLISKAELDPRVPHFERSLLDVSSLLLVPMRFRHEVMGIICVVNRVDQVPLGERDQNLLQALADQASLSIYYAQFRAALEEKRRMDQDLDLAQRIQKSLLPRQLPEVDGLSIHAFNLAAQEVGGDYYDVIPLDDQHVGFAVADVSGKGIGGALMMSICRSVLRAHTSQNLDPASVLREVNQTMVADMYEDMFVTMLYMVYNTETRELAMARAGHDPALLLLPGEENVKRMDSGGMGIGLVEGDLFGELIETVHVTLEPGAVVMVYTDGITEAMNSQQEEWGLEPLKRALQSSRKYSPTQISERVQERVLRFAGDTPQYDDMTLMVLKVDDVADEGAS